MKITGLNVDGFGVWSDLNIESLPESAMVVFGENEAGKTTLMQFVRSMLYGASPQRRARYLPPVAGGQSGGRLSVSSPTGSFQVERSFASDASNARLIASDGSVQSGHLLPTLLAGVDEAIFNNVFAVGLREIQELATLNDTEAAAMLYNLSAGLDRVSLGEVMRALAVARRRLLDAEGGSSRIADLAERRKGLKETVKQLTGRTRQYGNLCQKSEQLRRDVSETEEESGRLEHRMRVIELAHALSEKWTELDQVDRELDKLGAVRGIPADALEQLTRLSTRIDEDQSRVDRCRTRRGEMRSEYHSLTINEPLERNAAVVDVLSDQLPWMETLERQMAELETEARETSERLSSRRGVLGLRDENFSGGWSGLAESDVARLRPLARAMKQAKADLAEAKQRMTTARESADAQQQHVADALAERKQSDLSSALEHAGEHVSMLRRRIQIDDRLNQMARQQLDLEDGAAMPEDDALLPSKVLVACGSVFAAGVMLLLAGFFWGWGWSLLGLLGIGSAVVGKYWWQHNQRMQSEDRNRQLALVTSQIEEAEKERDELDARLPQGGGPLAVRLDTAQRKLAEIESLVPMDTDRQVADTRRESAAARARDAAEDLKHARNHWRRALVSYGLPDDLSPKQVARIADESRQISDLADQASRKQTELEQQQRQYATYEQRIHRIADEARIARQHRSASQTLAELVTAVQAQRDVVTRRQQLRQHARKLKRKQARYNESLEDLTRRRGQLLTECNVNDEESLRRIAADAAKAAKLNERQAAINREIDAAITGVCGRQEIETHLAATDSERLEQQFDQLAEQMRQMTEDDTLAEKKLDLACVEQQLTDAVREWHVLATIQLALESVRRIYERDRQPETLRDASQFLNRLTEGRYVRVWTPLDEDVLRVDDASGDCLRAEVLSRGTREQLFLSLRLALVQLYARRGVELPLVLDDVFVNFDTRRAQAAVKLLAEFSAAGHQLLVFTCHEHIAEMFRAADVEVLTLPDREHATSTITVEKNPVETIAPAAIAAQPVEVVVEDISDEDISDEDISDEEIADEEVAEEDDDIEDELEEEEEFEEEVDEDDDYEVAEEEEEDEEEYEEEAEEDELEDEDDEVEEEYDEDEEEEVLEDEEDEWEEYDDEEEEDDVSEAA